KKLTTTVALAVETIETTSEEEYLRKRKVQGFNLTGIGAVLHAVEHFSYHVGQVAFWVKQLTNSDLGFYDQQDLNQLNP
ncbi:MAG: DinB family protein, partial [Flavobacteriaceae bacterium]